MGNVFQDTVDAMQRDADMDMTVEAVQAHIIFPSRSLKPKVNPLLVENHLNVSIGQLPRCCQFLGLTSPEVVLHTPNMLSLMRQANTSWTKADFVTNVTVLDFNESRNSDMCMILAAYLTSGRFNISLTLDDIPSTSGNMIFFISCIAKCDVIV